jgi:dTDP-4-dehydrorhamnose 3,5-epimerase
MIINSLALSGAFLVEIERKEDQRGFFARTFCEERFAAAGMPTRFPQSNISFNKQKGTLRGMHFQRAPHGDPKLVRCTKGAIHDVIVDLRPTSATFTKSFGVELTEENRSALYVPPGFAHGFQTLEDRSEVLYLMGEVYFPELASGIRWNDPVLDVRWPLPISVIAERDRTFPDFEL